ncbi:MULTISPECIES: hypothetical protein [unclassified Lentimonas]|uniref:hypothetical protein n=1 Tax=unclassified Lentimonas TaxID=2630993 RepID=UPI00132B3655|nr:MULTISPECIES: hypothetical protein [unclassified Lentimonas]CAA6677385.1 Unannotated [Lentimonas sp. CC4]CAA6686930.1 Unannotated [Lentimonas sp. CC6]CAA6690113.1 Unannotated [Lentimonas sp. CC19]CAA6690925.1 Unannotated [Lentimonas sp. CC10]CAA7070723.1 Unannotated [Lentimonas sp. CC11]
MNTKEYLQAHRDGPKCKVCHKVQVDRGSDTTPFDPTTCHSIGEVTNNLRYAASWYFEVMPTMTEIDSSPRALLLQLPDDDGKPRTVSYRSDLLAMDHQENVALVELMSSKELKLLQQKHPERWIKDSRGQWHSPPLEEQILAKGFLYVLVTDEMIYEACQSIQEYPIEYLSLKKRTTQSPKNN